MLMTAVHMDSSTTAMPPPWLPVLAHHRHDFTPASASSLSPPPPAPSSHSHHHLPLRAARNRVAGKRRPRPSRRLPTTYINADPASFRRMVHQVTGADDLPPVPPQPSNNAAELLLTRPVRVRADALTNINRLLPTLPTLDTSAFLVSRTGTDAPSCDLKAMEAGGASCCNSSTFPTLESWEHHAPLY